jgi:hypothetical protein
MAEVRAVSHCREAGDMVDREKFEGILLEL